MPDTMEYFERRVEDEILNRLKFERLVKLFTAEQMGEESTPEQLVQGLTLEQRLAGLSPKDMEILEKMLKERRDALE